MESQTTGYYQLYSYHIIHLITIYVIIIHNGGPYCMYIIDANNVPIYGAKISFQSDRKLNAKKNILCIYYVHLTNTSYYIHGPINFDSRSNIIKSKK